MRLGIRELIFLMVLLAVPVASYIYVFQPRNEEIVQAQTEIEIKRARLDELAEVVAQIDDMGLAIESGRQAIEVIEAKLPNEQDVEGILEQVWQLAKRNQLNVRSVNSERPVPAASYMELPLRVVMVGPFDGFYQFLLELENLPRITRVHQMDLKRADGGPRSSSSEHPPGSTLASFTLSIYFEPRHPR